GEWAYEGGSWRPLYQVVPLDDALAVEREIARQLDEFRRLVGDDPTHLDSHQHAHAREPVARVARDVAQTLGVPLRGCDARIRYCGEFYGQTADGIALP